MTTTLPADPDTQRLAQKLAADTGRPIEAVVRDAIKAHAIRQLKLTELRATIDASIARGGSLTGDEVLRRIDDRLARERQAPANG